LYRYIEAPCVVVPGTAHALSGDQAEKFGRLAARMGNSAAGLYKLIPVDTYLDSARFQPLNLSSEFLF
jgi:hypothetical protein